MTLGLPIHQSKLSNETCDILQRLTISKFCSNGSINLLTYFLKLLFSLKVVQETLKGLYNDFNVGLA